MFITISTWMYDQHFSHTEEKKKQRNLVSPNENEGL